MTKQTQTNNNKKTKQKTNQNDEQTERRQRKNREDQRNNEWRRRVWHAERVLDLGQRQERSVLVEQLVGGRVLGELHANIGHVRADRCLDQLVRDDELHGVCGTFEVEVLGVCREVLINRKQTKKTYLLSTINITQQTNHISYDFGRVLILASRLGQENDLTAALGLGQANERLLSLHITGLGRQRELDVKLRLLIDIQQKRLRLKSTVF